MAITEGESETLCLRMPPESRIIIMIMHPRELKLPPLMVGATVGDAVGHVEPREVQALVFGLLLVTIRKEWVKASLIVGKWDVCTLTKERVHAADRCTFSHDLNVPVYVPKGKGKGKRKGSNSPRSASPAGRGGPDIPRGRDTPRGCSSPRRSSRGRSIDPAKYKTKPCDNFARGTCTFGDRCTFKHNG